MNILRQQIFLVVSAGVIAVAFSALEFQELNGTLGVIFQMLLIPLALFPFLLGAMMGGNVHQSGQPGFFIGSFIEFYFIVWVVVAWRNSRRKQRT